MDVGQYISLHRLRRSLPKQITSPLLFLVFCLELLLNLQVQLILGQIVLHKTIEGLRKVSFVVCDLA